MVTIALSRVKLDKYARIVGRVRMRSRWIKCTWNVTYRSYIYQETPEKADQAQWMISMLSWKSLSWVHKSKDISKQSLSRIRLSAREHIQQEENKTTRKLVTPMSVRQQINQCFPSFQLLLLSIQPKIRLHTLRKSHHQELIFQSQTQLWRKERLSSLRGNRRQGKTCTVEVF